MKQSENFPVYAVPYGDKISMPKNFTNEQFFQKFLVNEQFFPFLQIKLSRFAGKDPLE